MRTARPDGLAWHRRAKSKAGMPAIADAATLHLVVLHGGINLCHSVSPLRAIAAVRANAGLHRFRPSRRFTLMGVTRPTALNGITPLVEDGQVNPVVETITVRPDHR